MVSSYYSTTLTCVLGPLLQHITEGRSEVGATPLHMIACGDVWVVPQSVREIGLERHSSIMFCYFGQDVLQDSASTRYHQSYFVSGS